MSYLTLPNHHRIYLRAVVWEALQLNPALVGTYSRDDYQRRLRKIAPLSRDEMADAWGADEPALFDALVKTRADMLAAARERELRKWRQEAHRAQLKHETELARADKQLARAAKDPRRGRLHRLRAELARAKAEVAAEELRIAEAEIQLLDENTEVPLLWVR